MAPKSVQTAPEMSAGDPKHAARATRTAARSAGVKTATSLCAASS